MKKTDRPLGEVAEIVMGTSPKGKSYNKDGTGKPLLNGPTEFGSNYPSCSLFTTDSKRECQKGDLIFCVRGSTTGRMNWADRRYSLGRGVCSIRGVTEADTKFLRYCIEARLEALLKLSGGATFPNLTRNDLNSFTIPYPSNRREIAAIISAYDDLIENNTRRIRILEEVAQSLYREWFVNFRFPGHEKVKLVDSPLGKIPEGWDVASVADSFEITGGGTPSKKIDEYWNDGEIDWFVPSDLTASKTMFMEQSTKRITELGLRKSSARLFPAHSVMLTSRATIGVASMNTGTACTNQGFITCIPNEVAPPFFLYHWLLENKGKFLSLASGATFKEISKGVFRTVDFLLSDHNIVIQFEDCIQPMGQQILNLQRQNANLHRTRNLLLPKLIVGGLNVDNIPRAEI
ncbi:MAG: restriction endonuclease subunit S [Actinobacteria bacterium]|nr:restriction endonuclease subunit S [Actinomycetota bacterium]